MTICKVIIVEEIIVLGMIISYYIYSKSPQHAQRDHMMTSYNGNIFCIDWLLWGESTSHCWIQKDQWWEALIFSLILASMNPWMNTFHIDGPLWGNPPVTGRFPSQRLSDGEVWHFLICKLGWTVEQTIVLPVISDSMILIWHHCDVNINKIRPSV